MQRHHANRTYPKSFLDTVILLMVIFWVASLLHGCGGSSRPTTANSTAAASTATSAPATPAFTTTTASASVSATASSPSAASGTSGYQRFYADNSFWNTPIGSNPQIDPNSAAMVQAAMVAYTQYSSFQNTDDWGIPYVYATPDSKTYTVACTLYCTGDTVKFRIPAGAQVATGSDHHLVVIDGNKELDMWEAVYDPAKDTWSASVRVVNDITGWGATCAKGQHCNASVAAGFAALGGTVRPEEIAQGHIDHALHFMTPYTRASYMACPATNNDGRINDPAALPEGARLQLDPALDVDSQNWPAWQKIMAKALQTYGAYVVDSSGQIAFRGVTDHNVGNTSWASVGVPKGALLNNFPWNRMRVLQIQSCN